MMKEFIISLAFILFSININYCQQDMQKIKDEVKQADIDFSNHSKNYGVKAAFLEYAHSDAVLLRPYMMPVEGIVAVTKFMNDGDTNFELTWAPLFSDASISAELGYTYGTYSLKFKDETGTEQEKKGTYVSIWKKDPSGKWKYVLDTGNPGLEPKK